MIGSFFEFLGNNMWDDYQLIANKISGLAKKLF